LYSSSFCQKKKKEEEKTKKNQTIAHGRRAAAPLQGLKAQHARTKKKHK
jgi:hypothetical protein